MAPSLINREGSGLAGIGLVSLTVTVLLSMNLVVLPRTAGSNDIFPANIVTQSNTLDSSSSLGGYFIENRGQVAEEVRYYSRGDPAVAFRDDGVMFVVREHDNGVERQPWREPTNLFTAIDETSRVKSLAYMLRFEGANKVTPIGIGRLSFNSNFFIGNNPSRWKTAVPNYGEVVYRDLYDGIDLVYRQNGNGVKYEFVVSPSIDPGTIRMRYEGVDSIQADETGIVVRTAVGEIRDSAPYSFQGAGEQVACSFALRDPASYGFSCPGRDASDALTIDPLIYSTFLGGTDDEEGHAITADSVGNVYVLGYTGSTDFNVTPGAFDTTYAGNGDAFVTKLNAAGSSILFSTFLGGSAYEYGASVSVDFARYVYVAGGTQSNDFPTTLGAFDETYNDGGPYGMDGFVTKLSPTGDSLVYSTFLGGNDWDAATSLEVDAAGCAYVTGFTESGNFPTTPSARFPFHIGSFGIDDAFVTKLNTAGSALVYSTFLGGTSNDYGYSISIDSSGNAYVTGETGSLDFFTTPGAFQVTFDGSSDSFVTEFNPTGNTLVYSTFLGGMYQDEGYSIAVDASGNAYVAGETHSPDFPNTTGAFDTTFNGGSPGFPFDSFVAKLDSAGSALLYSTYLGGNGDESAKSLVLDSAGRAFVVGFTSSGDFPTTPGALDRSFDGHDDAFVAAIDPTGEALVYSTFLGGRRWDAAYGIALGPPSGAYVTGYTNSTEFPVTSGAFNPIYVGNPQNSSDAFIAKLDMIPLPDLSISRSDLWTIPPSPVTPGASVDIHVNVSNIGGANATNFLVAAFDDLNLNMRIDSGELIGTQAVTALRFGNSTELVFGWRPVSVGNHSVCGLADPPPGTVVESDETNNLACTSIGVLFSLKLIPGHRFMSFPVAVSEDSIESVLSSIVGCYDYVRWYDPLDSSDPWKSYVPGRTYNDLTRLDNTMGFWINITATCSFMPVGTRPVTTTINLSQGWNMVGFPSFNTTYTVADLKADIGLAGIVVEAFDAGAAPYYLQRVGDGYVMMAGEGYWVFAPSDATWTISG